MNLIVGYIIHTVISNLLLKDTDILMMLFSVQTSGLGRFLHICIRLVHFS